MQGILIEDERLKICNGSIAIGECSADVVQRLVAANTGEFKEAPTLGCNANKMISGMIDPFFAGILKQQLNTVGINVKVNANAENIEIKIK